MLIQARVGAVAGDQSVTAEERQLKLVDVIEGFIVKILNRGPDAIGAKDVKMLTSTILDSQDIRNEVDRRRRNREYDKRKAEEEAARDRPWRG